MGKDLITLQLFLPDNFEDEIIRAATAKRVRELAGRLDRIMFGKRGSLATSIKEQSGRGGDGWDALDPGYEEWKRWAKLNGVQVAEPAPNKIVSEKIWIRTGKMLEATQTLGNGRFKKIRVYPRALFGGGGPWVEWFISGFPASYYEFADASRPLFNFTDEDEKAMQAVVTEWLEQVIVAGLKASGLM